jgi:hypothetical protein
VRGRGGGPAEVPGVESPARIVGMQDVS